MEDCFFLTTCSNGVAMGTACSFGSMKIPQKCNCENCKNFISRNMARIVVKDWIKRRGEKTNDD